MLGFAEFKAIMGKRKSSKKKQNTASTMMIRVPVYNPNADVAEPEISVATAQQNDPFR